VRWRTTCSRALCNVQPEVALRALAARQLTLAVAEGDTGGLLLESLTAVPGSSASILGGVVAYHDSLKTTLLRVSAASLAQYGSVSAEVAEAMADGVRRITRADVGVATTGIAGGTRGLVREYRWEGDRQQNRVASAEAALALVLELLSKK